MLLNSRMYLNLSFAFPPYSQVDKSVLSQIMYLIFGKFNAIVNQACDL